MLLAEASALCLLITVAMAVSDCTSRVFTLLGLYFNIPSPVVELMLILPRIWTVSLKTQVWQQFSLCGKPVEFSVECRPVSTHFQTVFSLEAEFQRCCSRETRDRESNFVCRYLGDSSFCVGIPYVPSCWAQRQWNTASMHLIVSAKCRWKGSSAWLSTISRLILSTLGIGDSNRARYIMLIGELESLPENVPFKNSATVNTEFLFSVWVPSVAVYIMSRPWFQ